MKTKILFLYLINLAFIASAQNLSGLNKKDFSHFWKIESESADYSTKFSGDTLEITAPKGITLWRKEKMKGDITIDYDACIVDEKKGDRLSDLNCFWMATDPEKKNIWERMNWRSGIFNKCYSLQLYYMGFGGNNNTTTRFRRYNGDYKSFTNKDIRPDILKEYTDKSHLLKQNVWYHIHIENHENHVIYTINGERLIDFCDAHPLKTGWFGLRTTHSRIRITNFSYHEQKPDNKNIELRWIGKAPSFQATPATVGVPFARGVVQTNSKFTLKTDKGEVLPTDWWKLAYWPDGSIKWGAFATVVPANTAHMTLSLIKGKGEKASNGIQTIDKKSSIEIHTGKLSAYFSKSGENLFDSLIINHTKVADAAKLICQTNENYRSRINNVIIERAGHVRTVIKIEGTHCNDKRKWLPFVVRFYFYAHSEQIKMTHTIIFDGDQNKDFIHALGIEFAVPLREQLYNRHVAFAGEGDGVWSEPVQPLIGRRELSLRGDFSIYDQQLAGKRIPEKKSFDQKGQDLIEHWASWDGYRLSQISPRAFSIRKRTNNDCPWIGTIEGNQSKGYAFIGDVSGGLGVCLEDFWQSYPSSIEINGARTHEAHLTVWLWSPESEPMDLRHYDHVAHGLYESYEDVQKGMSTPYGIARTSTLQIFPESCFKGNEIINERAKALSVAPQLAATPQYLHRQHAFGIWSLPQHETLFKDSIEKRLDDYITYYQQMIKEHGWYGFWNYGDLMHSYDPGRHEWRYDIGGYAWDNTELGSNAWLWYSFLRTGRSDIWTMAKAISRHTGEVDVYHLGDYAGLGSRHNVSHWGCGAKEARISQAFWNRFLYYLTADERSGDLMTEEKDVDQKLYKLDPMRLAEPRSKFPCSAPARLRIGPDWIAYAGNWMTEWERTGNTFYRDKIIAGMKSIASLPHGLFTGNKALGYDPKTGIISYDGNPNKESTNHLMTIMGGFELMNELMEMIDLPAWKKVWTDHAVNYFEKAWEISHSHFLIPRLTAYGAYETTNPKLQQLAWDELRYNILPCGKTFSKKINPPYTLETIDENETVSTNAIATWGLDAIYLMEVLE